MNGKLDAKLERISQQIAIERMRYLSAVAEAVQGVLTGYGITIADLVAHDAAVAAKPERVKKTALKVVKKRTRKPAFKGPQPPRYQHPDGSTWSGFGRAPAWIATAKNRDDFLIEKQAA